MQEKKWTLDVESNQYDLEQGKFYLIGYMEKEETNENYVDIKLKSKSVDTKHCVVDASGTDLYIYDLRSRLGTFLNGKRLGWMLKECINGDVELQIGEVKAQLYLKENRKCLELDTSNIFLAPTHRAPRTSLANTSSRLFSSPKGSVLGDSGDESFNIPETQNIKRVSTENSITLNISRNQYENERSFADESFIPETQNPAATEQPNKMLSTGMDTDLTLDSNMHKSSEMLRICTQDFNENLFENGEDDEILFSSLVIPNIKHNPVILTHTAMKENINTISGLTASCGDAQMGEQNADTSQKTQCVEREDTCTPDLFDFPELAEINMQMATGETNMNLEEEKNPTGAPVEPGSKTTSTNGHNLSTNDGMSEGDGYAEEVELMPTQLFVPIPKKIERSVEEPATITGAELSLSGKENIPCTDFGLEQTQIFAPIKDGKSVENKCMPVASDATKVPTNEPRDGNTSLLPPTQIFTSNLTKSARQTTMSAAQQKLNSTLMLTGYGDQPKSVANFIEDVDDTEKGEPEQRKIITNQSSFKKPKPNKPKSLSSNETNEKHSSVNSSRTEIEDALLCTPKWISDNFDELSVERNISSEKKRKLFESDSEEDSVELSKKDSKDFERLLSNLKQPKPIVKLPKMKNLTAKKETSTQVSKAIDTNPTSNSLKRNEDAIEKVIVKGTEKDQSIKKDKNSPHQAKKFDEAVKPNKIFLIEPKKETTEIKVNRMDRRKHNSIGEDQEHKHENERRTKSSPKKGGETPVTPTKRMTRLRSRTSDVEIDLVSSTSSGPSHAKQRKIEQIDEPGNSKKRVTRSRSKTESQESITSTKSSVSSTRIATKRKNSREEQTQASIDKSSAEPSKHTKSNERKETGSVQSAEPSKHTKANERKETRSVKSAESLKYTKVNERKDTRSVKSAEPSKHTKANERKEAGSVKSAESSKDTKANERKETGSVKSAEPSKHTKANERKETGSVKSAGDSNPKRGANAPSDDEPKHSSSSTRTLQVAMTMVEPKVLQSLVDNSPGNWSLANDPTDIDVLVMDKGNRTLKFLIAMAKGIPIVTSKWLESFNSTKTVPRGLTHFFRDQEFEKRHKFSLLKSLELARKSKLFEGFHFLTTPGISPQPAEMKQIIECAGGEVHTEPPQPIQNQRVYLISTLKDKKYWHKYRRFNSNIRITNTEGVMASVMRQTTQPLEANIFA
ncbi:mediator of DNA damage checkpoint protein 1 [Anastrepha ludens]|uniref:mediator of DNA damage checkpoint protein 1 n=1 Tax=Anastrepha ludens TaxID=28586 RepID=UPI0023B0DA50|nr:mediator of DNA damage checkpoint protein 1 [Anastrepha ludens]